MLKDVYCKCKLFYRKVHPFIKIMEILLYVLNDDSYAVLFLYS